ncbi:carboxypeptidase regulatory-like domain-containing protein [Edaphobacter sp. HDX4]|uniref:carboxypeptidase-like regulatory domain-containing protein n=1 Tax=Edaphobacter sp. HDX4 TaxID=2794064 RepID=UPI002FE53BB9
MMAGDRLIRESLPLSIDRRAVSFTLSLALMLLGLGASPFAAQQNGEATASPSSAEPISLSGVVVNATNGSPVSRALVRINDRAMLTDHEGKFAFDQFSSAGSAVLEVRKPGYYSSPEMGVTTTMLRTEQMMSPLTVRLYPEGLMTGTVTSSAGTPLPRVFVSAMRSVYSETGHQWIPIGHSLTNSRGEFRLTVPPGDYRIETNFAPRVGGSSDAAMPLMMPSISDPPLHLSSGSQQQFELHPEVSRTYTVGLRVESGQEHGFPNLRARMTDGSLFPVSVLRGEDAGTDEMQVALPDGTFTLIANQSRGEETTYGEANVTVAGQDVHGVVLTMSSVAAIPVQIVRDPGSTSDKALPSPQQLGLMLENINGPRIGDYGSLVMNSRGSETTIRPTPGVYRFGSRTRGPWFVKSATYGSTDLLRDNMTVAWGAASSPIVVTISDQTGGLRGSTRLGSAGASIWIEVIPQFPNAVPFYPGRSDLSGNFDFPSLPPGSYQVIGFESRHSDNFRDPKTLAPYSTYIRNVTITAGNTAAVDLDAVPDTELRP